MRGRIVLLDDAPVETRLSRRSPGLSLPGSPFWLHRPVNLFYSFGSLLGRLQFLLLLGRELCFVRLLFLDLTLGHLINSILVGFVRDLVAHGDFRRVQAYTVARLESPMPSNSSDSPYHRILTTRLQQTDPRSRGRGPLDAWLGRFSSVSHDSKALSFPITSAVVDSGATSAICASRARQSRLFT